MSNQDRGHRPNGDFMTDEEMRKERQRKVLLVATLLLGALVVTQGWLPV